MIYLKTYEKYKESDVEDILNQISDFLNSNLRNTWICNDSIRIYIRKSKRGYNKEMLDFFDFASIDVAETSNGLFTQILKRFEEILPNPCSNFYKIKNNK